MPIKKSQLILATQQISKEKLEQKTPKRFTFTPTVKLQVELNKLIQHLQLQYPIITKNAIMNVILTQICKNKKMP